MWYLRKERTLISNSVHQRKLSNSNSHTLCACVWCACCVYALDNSTITLVCSIIAWRLLICSSFFLSMSCVPASCLWRESSSALSPLMSLSLALTSANKEAVDNIRWGNCFSTPTALKLYTCTHLFRVRGQQEVQTSHLALFPNSEWVPLSPCWAPSEETPVHTECQKSGPSV